MNEKELLELWLKTRNQLIFSQLAPTFLLITAVGLIPVLRQQGLFLSLATSGILLASGILGALVQFSSSAEAQAISKDLSSLSSKTAVSKIVVRLGPWAAVSMYLTPAIFITIFAFINIALYI
jgi:hypothetical protein